MDEGGGHDRLAEQRLTIEQAGGESADQPVPIGCAAAGEVERELEGDRPGHRSMEQLLERVLERASFDLDREHLPGGAPAREARRPVGPEDHAPRRCGDDPVRTAVRARLPRSDQVDLVGVQVWFGIDPNLGVVREPAKRDRP